MNGKLSAMGRAFVTANAQSPVVYGAAIDPKQGGKGAIYRLANNMTFKLKPADLAQITPRWSFDPPFSEEAA